MPRALAALGLFVTFALNASLAAADPAAAEALFQEGRTLLDQGKVAEACEKFSSSHAHEPSSGTLLNLADCRQKQGKTATAWAHFVAAERLARVQGRPEHEREALRRKRELEPELSSLTLKIDVVAGLVVSVNGRTVDLGSIGSRMPTDPGPVRIEASAPGHVSARIDGTLEPSGHELVIAIPPLERTPQPNESAAPSEPAPERDASGSGALPWIVAGSGAALLVTGGVFGVMALSANSEAERLCNQRTSGCPDEALEKESERDRYALLSTIGIGVGLAGIGVGAVLLLSSGSRSESRSASSFGLDTSFGPSRVGVRARLAF